MTAVSKAGLAKELNVTTAAVNVWVKRGLRSNARGQFDREQAFQWISQNIEPQLASSGVSRGSTRASELLKKSKRDDHSNGGNGHDIPELNAVQQRARRDLAMAERIELQNAVSRNELVYIEDVCVEVAGVLAVVRNKLLGLPAKIAPSAHMAAAEGRRAVYQVIEREVLAVLHDLSGAGDAEDEAAA